MLLFRQFILRHLLRERLRSFVTVFGIAIGIAVVIAIQLTNASSVHGFEAAIETISGKTSLEIVGPGTGFDESLFTDLMWLRKYGDVSPVIQGDARIKVADRRPESITVLGIDILRDRSLREYSLTKFGDRRKEPNSQEFLLLLIDPHSIILSNSFAGKMGLTTGQNIKLTIGDRQQSFVIRGLLKNRGPANAGDGNFALMDIAAAQWAFDRLGKIDRVDLRLNNDISIDAAEREVANRLPVGLAVQRPAQRGRQVEKMLSAFQFNLTALSYIALLVGLFLIYNTVSTSVITRREEVGTLRALGVSRKRVIALFLSEAVAFAILGGAAGILIGRVFAYFTVKFTTTTVRSLYVATAAAPVALELRHFVLAFALALPLSLIAAAAPAFEASRVTPVAALRDADRLESKYRLNKIYLLVPAFLFALAWLLAQMNPVRGLPFFGYGSALIIVFAAAFLVPSVLYLAGRLGTNLLTRFFKIEGKLAVANLSSAIPRISISVAALAVSLSMMVAIAIMIGSFRETVVYWVGQTLRADLYMRAATRVNIGVEATISPEVQKLVLNTPLVESVDRYRNFDIPYEGGLVTLGSGDFSEALKHEYLLFKYPSDWRSALQSAIGNDAVIISESLSIRHSKRIGDSIAIPTPKGEKQFRIVGIYYDYASDRGVVVMDFHTYEKYFGAQQPTSLSVYLQNGADPDQAKEQILSRLGDQYEVFIFTNSALRREVLRIFDSTFAITYALEAIAILVAIIGIASTLLTLILERKREITMLRQVGADRRQIRKMVIIEALMLGGVSQSIGIAVGFLLSLVLIFVINVQSFGWTIQFHIPFWFLIQSTVLILAATALSGIYPARRAAAFQVAEKLRMND